MPPRSRREETELSEHSGFTLMVLGEPGQKARKIHIPRWLVFASLFVWLFVLTGAFLWGFEEHATWRAGLSHGALRTAMAPAPSSRQ